MNNKKKTLEDLLKEKIISQRTYDKAKIAKEIIERKYNLKNIENAEWNYIIEKINSLDLNEEEKEKIKRDIFTQQSSKYRFFREKQTIKNYESLTIIGRGAFGEVHVCREKATGEIVAIKKIKKKELFSKNQVIHVRNEQLFMSKVKNPWIVELKASFQDEEYLYLVMEYLPGGDLMNLLIQKDILTEEEARFYIAELILSIESIHKLDCIHRDIKPDNILIDKNGHIKLSDFGLAKISEKLFEQKNNNNIIIQNFKDNNIKKHEKNYSCVGTAYYVAPEVLNKEGYGKEADWWSVGVIFFEMLFGYAPFCSKETSEVCHKILNWEKYLKIPSKIKISREAEDLIAKLINNSNKRLGLNGPEEIKSHPFFKDLNWDNITNLNAPFIPQLKNEYDTHYFDKYEIKEPFYPNIKKKKKRKDIEYLGYTYKDDPKNNIDIFIEFQNAIRKLKKEKNDLNITPNETFIGNTHSQTKTSSNKLNENKINLSKTINNINIKNCLDFNYKTEPNNKEIANGFEKNYLINSSINYKYNNDKEIKNYKNGKSIDKNEVKLNIIQLPNKKITKKIKNQKLINNKLITINNVIKKNNNNYTIISQDKKKNKSLKKDKKNNINIFNSILRKKPIKLSPSPNQKNIFLMKLIDKSKSKQKAIRAISGDNTRNKKNNINNSMKKPISQNILKKISAKKKNTSTNKGKNSLLKKCAKNNIFIYNKNQKNIRKNINLINIGNKDIFNTSERYSSPSQKITYIYKKKKE